MSETTTVTPHVPSALSADAPDAHWWQAAESAVHQLAASGATFTADELRRAPLAIPDPAHHSRWGGLFAALARRGVIEAVGYGTSATRSRRHGSLKVWRGVQRRPTAA